MKRPATPASVTTAPLQQRAAASNFLHLQSSQTRFTLPDVSHRASGHQPCVIRATRKRGPLHLLVRATSEAPPPFLLAHWFLCKVGRDVIVCLTTL